VAFLPSAATCCFQDASKDAVEPDAAGIVERVNHGNRTVPTLVYEDGTAQTNPSAAEVKAKLAELS